MHTDSLNPSSQFRLRFTGPLHPGRIPCRYFSRAKTSRAGFAAAGVHLLSIPRLCSPHGNGWSARRLHLGKGLRLTKLRSDLPSAFPGDPLTGSRRIHPQSSVTNVRTHFFFCPSGRVFSSQPMIAEETENPKFLTERVSCGYGLMIARQLGERGVEIDIEQFVAAFDTVKAGGKPVLYEDEVAAAFDESQKQVDEKNATGPDREYLEAGKKFLEDNAKKDGLKVTDSGLQYEVIEASDGKKPVANDTVRVHYQRTLIDGTVFDSSVGRGETEWRLLRGSQGIHRRLLSQLCARVWPTGSRTSAIPGLPAGRVRNGWKSSSLSVVIG